MNHAPDRLGPRKDPEVYKGRTVDCARRFAHIGGNTNWINTRLDCVDRPEYHYVVPDHCWHDQAIYGPLLVPVLAWSNGDGTFSAWPLKGAWPKLNVVRAVLDEIVEAQC